MYAASAQSAISVWDGVFTDEQVKRGQAAYQKECAGCHGSALEGGDMTPSLVGAAFTSNWNDLTLGDLFERIRLTMPLDSPGRLSRQQNADVIAYVLKTNEWPSGAARAPVRPGAAEADQDPSDEIAENAQAPTSNSHRSRLRIGSWQLGVYVNNACAMR